jgi:hypothetical protein
LIFSKLIIEFFFWLTFSLAAGMFRNTALELFPQSTGMVPVLPPELEREIFEMSARIHPKTAVRLVLVARRVQIW